MGFILNLSIVAAVFGAPARADLNQVRERFARLGDPFSGVTPARFVALAMGAGPDVDGEPLRAHRAFRWATGDRALGPGEVTAHHMEIFAALAPFTRDFADYLRLARAPGREPFVRHLVSDAMVSRKLDQLAAWPLSAHDWATVLTFWFPVTAEPRECARIAARFKSTAQFRIALRGVDRADLRACLEGARPLRCRTYLRRGDVVRAFP